MMTELQTILDISPLISPALAVFPGDQPFHREISLSFEKGHHLNLSHMTATLHLGAHADGPNHYHPQGADISQRDLRYYLGPALVIDVSKKKLKWIQPKDLPKRDTWLPRVLFKTGTFSDPNLWRDDFCALSPELIAFLAEKKVITVGIDTPSIDRADSKDLPTHHAVYEHRLAVLEGLFLDHISEGEYFLSALPLKIAGGDAAPVRAVLIKE